MALRDEFQVILSHVRQDEKSYVRMAVIGQPGAGKSTLINMLLGKKVAETGPETDKTVEAASYEYNFQRIVDLPGYATSKFKFDDWKQKFNLEQYDMYLYVFRGKLLEEDNRLFSDLEEWNKDRKRPIFLIRNFAADVESRETIAKDVGKHMGLNNPPKIYFVDFRPPQIGVDELKDAIWKTDFSALLVERLQTAFRKAKASYIHECREKASDEISTYTKLAALNGINPLLGVDVAADIGIYLKMFSAIRDAYGIEDGDLNLYTTIPVVKKILELMTKEGILILLKNFAGRTLFRSFAKYIPLAGQAASATIGYKMADYVGQQYDDDCCEMAKSVMDQIGEEEMNKFLQNKKAVSII